MSTTVDSAAPSASPGPDDGSGGHGRLRDEGAPDAEAEAADPDGDRSGGSDARAGSRRRAASAGDSSPRWLKAEIERRIAANASTGGRHARRDARPDGPDAGGPRPGPSHPATEPDAPFHVPRHSEQTPGPGARPPGPVGGPSLPPTGIPVPPHAPRSATGPGVPLRAAGSATAWAPPPTPDAAAGPAAPTRRPAPRRLGAPPPDLHRGARPAAPSPSPRPAAAGTTPLADPAPAAPSAAAPSTTAPSTTAAPPAADVAAPTAPVPVVPARPAARPPTYPGVERIPAVTVPAPRSPDRGPVVLPPDVVPPAGADATDETPLLASPDHDGPRRVRVVLSERKSVARPVRTIDDVQQGTPVGELLRTNLIRTQRVLALRFAVGAVLVLGALPVLFLLVPTLGRVELLGVRLPWVVLGVLVYPFLLGLGWWHTRAAERVEQGFADHVQD